MTIVIPSVGSLGNRQAAEFSAPHHQCPIQQPPLLQISDQRGAGLINPLTVCPERRGIPAVRVPGLSGQKQLHESDTTFDQATRNQTPRGILGSDRVVHPVHRLSGSGFV